jgi:hypothetical protein
MRLVRHKTLVSAMAFMAIAPVGYARSQPTGTNHSSKLLTAKAGTQLVNVALRYQPEDGVKPDCSHLVYEIYRQAGLNFRFASSRELYVGVGRPDCVARTCRDCSESTGALFLQFPSLWINDRLL